MITFQDLQQITEDDKSRADFVRKVINDHKTSEIYKTAVIADQYDRCRNTTITQYQKMVTLVTGQVVPDKYTATHRSCTNFFGIFVTQLTQYLLGNGVIWESAEEDENGDLQNSDYFGDDFDIQLQKLGKAALIGGVAFGFWDSEKLNVFTLREFAPIYDEENGALSAGVRFWQIDESKPLRATLYESDGYTNYLWSKNEHNDKNWQKIDDQTYMQNKKPYTWATVGDAKDRAEGTVEIVDGEPLNGFPIVPMYANDHRQSEIIGLREKIDAYDFILNGFEDDLDNAKLYWIIKGAGGMDDMDLQQFLDRLKTNAAAAPGDGQEVTPVPVDIPVAARESLLERLNRQLYRDAMIMNPEDLASGAVTATQIRAAYERQNCKADGFEYCVLEFLDGLKKLAGIDDKATFTRSTIVNVQEEIQTVLQAAQFLDADYVTRKILTILGDGDKAEKMIQKRIADELAAVNIGAEDESDGEAVS